MNWHGCRCDVDTIRGWPADVDVSPGIKRKMTSVELNTAVTRRMEVSPGLIILQVVPDDFEVPDFEAGQFAVLGLPESAPRYVASDPEEEVRPPERLIKRAYSIASSSTSKNYLEFYISLVHSGALTPRIFALERGDRIWLSPKISGLFTLSRVPANRNVLLIATGTGLAPYMSMLRSELVCGGSRRFGVLHGARHSWDLGYQSELLALQRMCSNFAYVPAISRPDDEPVGWPGRTGYLQDLWRSRAIEEAWGTEAESANTHIFLCGNPRMIEDLSGILREEGFREHTSKEPGQVHLERYW